MNGIRFLSGKCTIEISLEEYNKLNDFKNVCGPNGIMFDAFGRQWNITELRTEIYQDSRFNKITATLECVKVLEGLCQTEKSF